MNDGTNNATCSVTVSLEDALLEACIRDGREDVVATFGELTPVQRERAVEDVWSIGLRAVMNARALAQEARLGDVGQELMSDLGQRLDEHLKRQQEGLVTELKTYFDPKDGRVAERLDELLKDEGALASLLRRFVGENGVLAETVSREVGERSKLFRLLSPTESEGLVQVLQAKVGEALEQNRGEVARALDPLQKDGAVGRFLASLKEQVDATDGERSKRFEAVLKALDANDETSLISRLMRETERAHRRLRDSMDPTQPDSPLASVKKTLEELLESQLGEHEERLEKIAESQEKFQTEVREAVARLETRRDEVSNSARGGDEYEVEVRKFVSSVVPAGPCTVEATGATVGLRPSCKKGDVVVRFGEESAFAGCGIVIEAKHDKSYSAPKALAELEEAMPNRDASVGVFVQAKTHAPDGYPAFARYGSKLLVTWDENDARTDGNLHGAIVAALALAQRKHLPADQGDVNALAAVEQRLAQELSRLGKIEMHASRIQGNADSINEEVRKGRKKVRKLIDDAKKVLTALKVELREEEDEIAKPIVVESVRPRPEPGDSGKMEAGDHEDVDDEADDEAWPFGEEESEDAAE